MNIETQDLARRQQLAKSGSSQATKGTILVREGSKESDVREEPDTPWWTCCGPDALAWPATTMPHIGDANFGVGERQCL